MSSEHKQIKDPFLVDNRDDTHLKKKDNESDSSSSKSKDYKQKKNELKQIYEANKKVLIPLLIGIFLSLVISGLGIAIIIKSFTRIGVALVIFGIFSGLSFGFGILTSRMYSTLCEEYLIGDKINEDPEAIDQSTERNLLNISLYLLMLLFIIFFLISLSCFAFQGQIKNQITGMSRNKTEWIKYFGDYTYDQVYSSASSVMYATGSVCIVLALFILVLLYFAFNLLGSYRTWQTIIQFICVIFLKLGLVFLYFSIYAGRYKEVANVEKAMPHWIPDALLGVSILTIILAVLGYIAAWAEKENYLKYFSIAIGIFTVFIIILSVGAVLYSSSFEKYFEAKCSKILDYINADYLEKFIGCKKYTFVSNSFEGMQCPKSRIVTFWEGNVGKALEDQQDLYGCLEQDCCYATYNWIHGKMNILALVSVTLVLAGALLVGGSWYMVMKISTGDEISTTTSKIQYCVLGVLGVIVLLIIIMIALIPNPPKPSPTSAAVIDSAPTNNTKIDPSFVIQQNTTEVIQEESNQKKEDIAKETNITEDKSSCGEGCLKLRYFFEISSDDGVFQPNMTALNNTNATMTSNEHKGNGGVITFTGNETDLRHYTNYFNFIHNCPLIPAMINMKITATAYNPNNLNITTSLLQLQSTKKISSLLKEKLRKQETNNEEVYMSTVDLSKLKEGETYVLLNKQADYSFVNSNNKQKIKGKVMKVVDLKNSTPVRNARVTYLPIDYPKCGTYETKTDENGVFLSDPINVMNNDVKIQFKFEVSSPDLSTYKSSFETGGLAWEEIIDLGYITLWDPSMAEPATLKSITLSSINNHPLPDVNVSLYSGYMDFSNSEAETVPLALLIQTNSGLKALQNETTNNNSVYIKSAMSEHDGSFNFTDLAPNTYTLVLEKYGYYREVAYIDVIGNLTKPLQSIPLSPYVDEGKLRFVLSWPGLPKDLDLHSFFKISRFSKCQVYFGKRSCVGTNLDTDNLNEGSKGVETITINTLGKYVYTFAVNKYIDVSNGIAKGEDPVEGAPIEENYNKAPNASLADSKAKISIYTHGYKGPVYQLEIARFEKSNLIEQGEEDPLKFSWWYGLCLNGSKGLNSIVVINKLSTKRPDYSLCESLYNQKKSFLQLRSKKLRLN